MTYMVNDELTLRILMFLRRWLLAEQDEWLLQDNLHSFHEEYPWAELFLEWSSKELKKRAELSRALADVVHDEKMAEIKERYRKLENGR